MVPHNTCSGFYISNELAEELLVELETKKKPLFDSVEKYFEYLEDTVED